MKNGKLDESDFMISYDGLTAWIGAGWSNKNAARKWLREALKKM